MSMSWLIFQDAEEADTDPANPIGLFNEDDEETGEVRLVMEASDVRCQYMDGFGVVRCFSKIPSACQRAIVDQSEPVYVMRNGKIFNALPPVQVRIAS